MKQSFLICVMLLALCVSSAHAGKKPSAKTCQDSGMITARCIRCSTGQQIGQFDIGALYSAQHGDCLARILEARKKCAMLYDVPFPEVGAKMTQSMGFKKYHAVAPRGCGD